MRWCAPLSDGQHPRGFKRPLGRLAAHALAAMKPPAFGLGAFVLYTAFSPALATPHPAIAHEHTGTHASSAKAPPPKRRSLRERLQQAEHDLHHAQNDHDAQRAWNHAEQLRQRTLSPGVQLMVKDSLEQAQKGEVDRAEHQLSATLTMQPDNAFLRRQRAAIRLLGNDPTGAVQDIGISLNEDPRDPTAWMMLAEAQEKLHHSDLALHAFEEAISCTPYLPDKDKRLAHYKQRALGRED
ncbi:tetratricopeptide repeat protein [Saccharibacter floricola]|nr:hypothetical protein [Saccharibacter floricola]